MDHDPSTKAMVLTSEKDHCAVAITTCVHSEDAELQWKEQKESLEVPPCVATFAVDEWFLIMFGLVNN